MSRLAKKPILLPAGVTCTQNGQTLVFQGPKWTLEYTLSETVTATVDGNSILLTSKVKEGKQFAQWGLAWAIIQSKIKGVSAGYSKTLEIQWVGYRNEISGNKITLAVGFSHKVTLQIPAGISLTPDAADANKITVSGIDAQKVGEFAGKIRAVKTPEPYKGKGIRYSDEYVRRKAGKTGAK